MKEIIKSLFETSRERIKNPFIGTFILSWFVINWELLLTLLFSNKNIEERIADITINYINIYSNLFIPLFIAMVYVIILPYFMWLIEELLKKSIIGRKKNIIKQKIIDIKGKQDLAGEESELENIKARFRDKADLNIQIKKLKIQLDSKNSVIESQLTDLSKLKEDNAQLKLIVEKDDNPIASKQKLLSLEKQYTEFMVKDLFEYFKEIGISIREGNQFPKNSNNIIKDKYLYDEIIERIDDRENQQTYYKFTEKGNFFWKKFINKIKVKKQDTEIKRKVTIREL